MDHYLKGNKGWSLGASYRKTYDPRQLGWAWRGWEGQGGRREGKGTRGKSEQMRTKGEIEGESWFKQRRKKFPTHERSPMQGRSSNAFVLASLCQNTKSQKNSGTRLLNQTTRKFELTLGHKGIGASPFYQAEKGGSFKFWAQGHCASAFTPKPKTLTLASLAQGCQ